MHKQTYTHIVHFLIVCLCTSSLQVAAQRDISTVAISSGGRTSEVVSQHVVVRFRQARSIIDAQHVLPPGFEVVEQLLPPSQTQFFRTQTMALRPLQSSSSDLYSAEERLTRTFVVGFTGPASPLHIAQVLTSKHATSIEIAEPWYVAAVQSAPNDPEIGNQFFLKTIKAFEAWDVYQGADSVIIGISDDGIRQDHEDLAPNIAVNTKEIPDNGADDDGNGYIDDYNGYNFAYQIDGTQPGSTTSTQSYGHGTKVAGLASAATDNGKGIAGMGYKSRFFPMKTAKRTGGGIIFGYQSLIYAAQRGFRVVNTSWGVVKPFSQIDQSVIDYCVASNVLIVASGGNHGQDEVAAAWRLVNFPAGYRGVLGVGETTVDDLIVPTSGIGVNSDVYAPGYEAYTTEAPDGYTSFGIQGTSFASPIVAGLAGLVRGKWPNLTPMETAEHIRATSDDISISNSTLSDFVPKRVNAERALIAEPFARPGVRITGSTVRLARTGESRYRVGDTVELVLRLTNYLADVNLETMLRVVDPNGWDLGIVNEGQVVGSMPRGSVKTMLPITLIVRAVGTGDCVLGLVMSGTNYEDRDFVMVSPPTSMNRFENDRLIYAMSDDGMVGYSAPFDPKYGDGFGWKPSYSMLSSGGLFAQTQGTLSVSAYKNDPPFASDFLTSKPFGRAPEPSACVMSDSLAFQPIGMQVTQDCKFISPTASSTVWNVKIQPSRADAPLSNIGLGYVFDWDLGPGGADNRIVHDTECIPSSARGQQSAGFVVSRDGYPVALCVAAVGSKPTDAAQAACMLLDEIVDDGDGFSSSDRIQLLTRGTTIQTPNTGDVAGSIGMLRPGAVSSAEPFVFRVVIGVGATVDAARTAVREAIDATTSVAEYPLGLVHMWPNPTSGDVHVEPIENIERIDVVDAAGRMVVRQNMVGFEVSTIATSNLMAGAYQVVFYNRNGSVDRVATLIRQ